MKKSKKYSLPIEQDKLDDERGYYLHPELYNQPEEQSLMRLHHPDIASSKSKVEK